MKQQILLSICALVLSLLFAACGSNGGDTNTTNASFSSSGSPTLPCELNISWGSCGEPEYLDIAYNAPTNLLGQYGDDVYFGNKKIVGKWKLFGIDDNGSKEELDVWAHTYFEFYSNGSASNTTLISSQSRALTYGVIGAHTLILTDNTVSLPEIFSLYTYRDECYLVVKYNASYFVADALPYYFCPGWD